MTYFGWATGAITLALLLIYSPYYILPATGGWLKEKKKSKIDKEKEERRWKLRPRTNTDRYSTQEDSDIDDGLEAASNNLE